MVVTLLGAERFQPPIATLLPGDIGLSSFRGCRRNPAINIMHC